MLALVALGCSLALFAAGPVTFEKRPAFRIGNDKIEVLVLPKGAMIASILFKDDRAQINPLWNSTQLGSAPTPDSPTGHFIAVDGIGEPSAEEKAQGMGAYGEAWKQQFALDSSYTAGEGVYELTADLPLAQEHVTRRLTLRKDEEVLQIDTEIESAASFDRPLLWAERAAIGSPFLEPDATVVDMPAVKSQTRSWTETTGHRLKAAQEFKWPLAPGNSGKFINLRAAPAAGTSNDQTASLLDPERKTAFVTMLNTRRRLMLGYLFRTADFPWVENWESYRGPNKLARGLAFGTAPWEMSRKDALESNSLFGTLFYRWMRAKSKITSRFLMFYTRVPANLVNVDDVRLESGNIVIEDKVAKINFKIPTKATMEEQQ